MSAGPARLALVIGTSAATVVFAAGIAVAASRAQDDPPVKIPEKCVEARGGQGSPGLKPGRGPKPTEVPTGDATLEPFEPGEGTGDGFGDGDGFGEGGSSSGTGDTPADGPGDQPTGVPTPAEPLPVPPPEEIRETARDRDAGGSPLSALLIAILVAALLAAIAFVVARLARRDPRPDADDPYTDPTVTAEQAQELAVVAERAADWEAALRWTFVQGLVRLGRADVLPYDPTRPTREVSDALRSLRFDGLAEIFDAVAYGRRPATADDVTAARAGWEQLLAEQAAAAAPPTG